MTIDHRGTTALITGASSGLGAEFARQLAARGADLVLVARRRERLEALAADLRATGRAVEVVVADLALPRAGRDLAAELDRRGVAVDTVVANAGFATHGPLVEADGDRLAQEIAVDVAAVVYVVHAFLPRMVAADRGAVVTVASTAAYQAVPRMAVYGAAKAFVLSFTEAVAHEVRATGVRVLALSPGATETEFFEIAGEAAQVGPRRQPVVEVVRLALDTLDRRRGPSSVVAGLGNRLTASVTRLFPRGVVTALTGRLMGA